MSDKHEVFGTIRTKNFILITEMVLRSTMMMMMSGSEDLMKKGKMCT